MRRSSSASTGTAKIRCSLPVLPASLRDGCFTQATLAVASSSLPLPFTHITRPHVDVDYDTSTSLASSFASGYLRMRLPVSGSACMESPTLYVQVRGAGSLQCTRTKDYICTVSSRAPRPLTRPLTNLPDIWVFMNQFGTIVIYLMTFYKLRSKTGELLAHGQSLPNSQNAQTVRSVNRITLLMTLYPCVYVLLTLPLSSGRMWSMSHNGRPTDDVFSCVAGSLLTSCGWVDSLLYTLTRKRLLEDTMPNSSRRTLVTYEIYELEDTGTTRTRRGTAGKSSDL